MLKLISGGVLALGGAGLLGVLALGGAGFDALGASAQSPSTTLVLVCDRTGVVSADVTVDLWTGDPLAGGTKGPTESISCNSGDLRNRERVVTYNAGYADVTMFHVVRTPVTDEADCPTADSVTLKAVCPAGSPQATLTVR